MPGEPSSSPRWSDGGLLDADRVDLELRGYTLEVASGSSEGRFAGDVLRPVDASQPTKIIDERLVRLLLAAERGPVRVGDATGWDVRDIAAVVLDGAGCLHLGGRRISGPTAVGELFPALLHRHDDDPLRRLSANALTAAARYVGSRPLHDVLYTYGRLPVGDAELARQPSRDATSHWLGLGAQPGWLAPWQQRDPAAAGWWNLYELRGGGTPVDPYGPVVKLYVSPYPADLPAAFRELGLAAAELGVPVIKVGSDVHAVHRPDKLVAYLSDEAQLDALVVGLLPRLRGLPAHGVPFTAERGGDGLLSWGVDAPPAEPGAVRQSWRQRVTEVAADGLRRARGHDEATAVAMARAWLWVNDVDPVAWTPV